MIRSQLPNIVGSCRHQYAIPILIHSEAVYSFSIYMYTALAFPYYGYYNGHACWYQDVWAVFGMTANKNIASTQYWATPNTRYQYHSNPSHNLVFTSSSGKRCLVFSVGKPLPHSADGLSAPYSTTTSSSMQFTRRQNSLSATEHGTVCTDQQSPRSTVLADSGAGLLTAIFMSFHSCEHEQGGQHARSGKPRSEWAYHPRLFVSVRKQQMAFDTWHRTALNNVSEKSDWPRVSHQTLRHIFQYYSEPFLLPLCLQCTEMVKIHTHEHQTGLLPINTLTVSLCHSTEKWQRMQRQWWQQHSHFNCK